MQLPTEKAVSLTEINKGKHHIGDFLPPKELEKFIEKAKAIKEGRNPGEHWRMCMEWAMVKEGFYHC